MTLITWMFGTTNRIITIHADTSIEAWVKLSKQVGDTRNWVLL